MPRRIPIPALVLCAALFAAFWPASSANAQEAANSVSKEAEEEGTEQVIEPQTPFKRPGQTGLPLPRFVSLRSGEVNLRTGPGVRYPIDWVYRRRGLPVEIIDEFDTWRRIRDWQGTVGWVHQSMLQGKRTILINGAERTLRKDPRSDAPGLAIAKPGVLGDLKTCQGDWCQVTVQGFSGWMRREDFYGIYPQETP